ncbi:MAG: SUMF1/EgtB/PvdO family nonheme iron enzyme [Phycisphaerae bacterium]|nr:SUMF1/EgtB/PvdO family nonheme iron enzyme [Phycisphaerae bacterium]
MRQWTGEMAALVLALTILAFTAGPVRAVNNGDVPVNTVDSARRMILDLATHFGAQYTGGAEYLKRLNEIEAQLKQDRNDRAAQAALETVIRTAALANPLLDRDTIIVIRRKGEANRSLNSHTSETIKRTGWDNDIAELSQLRSAVQVRPIYRHGGESVMKHLDLDYSGEHVMFSGVGRNGNWAILEVDMDGGHLTELTPDDQDGVQWFDGCYLPEKDTILSCSTAGMQGLPCENGGRPMVNLYRVATDSKQVRQLTFEQDSDWHPRVLPNGRVLYLRWEYTDTPHYYSRYLFHMNPDGTGQQEYWGSGSYFPTAFVWARPVPNHSSMVVGIVSGHHAKSETGRLMLIDPALGRKYPLRIKPTSKIWGEENTEINIHPAALPAEETGCVQELPGWGRHVVGNVYDNQGGGQTYTFGTPYPLSDKYFLVSLQKGEKWVLALADVFDNITVVYEDPQYSIFEPMMLEARPRPPVLADRVVPEAKSSVVFCTDIYNGPGMKGIPRGTVKKLRVFTYHYGYIRSGGHESCGLESSWDIKRILGTVPVEEDGSFSFEAPANMPLSIQPIDAQGAALALMRSWMVGMPGEVVSCNGCHENQSQVTSVKMTVAGRREPRQIAPWYGPARPFAYTTEVQPVLDRFCLDCHNEQDRKGGLSFETGNAGDWRKDKSYLNLVAYTRHPGPESDLDLYHPMEWHASTSPLIQMFKKGHHGVSLDQEAWDRLYTWIDLNAPHRGMWNNPDFEKRRLDLARLYANVGVNPEQEHRRSLEQMGVRPVVPVPPRPEVKGVPDQLTVAGFPMSASEARTLQGDKGPIEIPLDDDVSVALVRIPAGQFVMGAQQGFADESPRSQVEIDRPFWMGVTEITNRQYQAFDPKHDTRYLDETGKDHAVPGYIANHADQPVSRVSWQEAMAFCEWLSQKCGRKVTLPTEAQWEWAARSGSGEQFFYGDKDTDFSRWANLADASRRRTQTSWDGGSRIHVRREYPADSVYPLRDDRFTDKWFIVDYVRQYEPSPWGLYDMVGNVSEWTRSDYRAYPYQEDGRNHGDVRTQKVARGGSWNDRPRVAGSSVRFAYESYQKVYNVGFRVIVEQ